MPYGNLTCFFWRVKCSSVIVCTVPIGICHEAVILHHIGILQLSHTSLSYVTVFSLVDAAKDRIRKIIIGNIQLQGAFIGLIHQRNHCKPILGSANGVALDHHALRIPAYRSAKISMNGVNTVLDRIAGDLPVQCL